jgi:hypothetical protein
MMNISKIVVLFFTLLISYINSGLLKSYSFQEKLTYIEESYPSSEHLSLQNIFLCPVPDLIIKNNQVPGKTDKLLEKIKIKWGLWAENLIIKNHLYHLKPEAEDPILIADLFSSSDISFPFDYFW